MHKTLIALAIAGLAAAPAFADSNVTLYGVVDYGFGMRSGSSGLATGCNNVATSVPGVTIPNPLPAPPPATITIPVKNATTPGPGAGCGKQEFISGVSVPNKLGFKGAEDLGNGTKAIFELEMGYNLNTGNNSIGGSGYSDGANGGLFRRHAWVGLTGEWGTLLGGRVDGARYGVLGKYDPFENGSVANAGSLQVHAQRADNAIAYVTPNIDGLYAVIAYTGALTGTTNAYNTGDARLWAVQPNYVNGPISATLNYERLTVHNNPVNATINIYVAGASYDFGVAKISAYWEHVKTNTDTGTPPGGALADQTSWLVGGSVPITENDKVRAVYVDYTDKSSAANSCRKYGVGALHFFSKRTNLYADFASISQRDNGHCTINYTPTKAGTNGDGSNQTGVGTRGFDVGMTHRF